MIKRRTRQEGGELGHSFCRLERTPCRKAEIKLGKVASVFSKESQVGNVLTVWLGTWIATEFSFNGISSQSDYVSDLLEVIVKFPARKS